jgi:hypothetical protein
MATVKDELRDTVKDWQQTGDAKGHAVALWRVLTGRVRASDRYTLTDGAGDRQDRERKTGSG